jgi:Ni/Co efflux regulator RcnB
VAREARDVDTHASLSLAPAALSGWYERRCGAGASANAHEITPTQRRSMTDTPFIARGFHRRRGKRSPRACRQARYETRDFPSQSPAPLRGSDWTFPSGVDGQSTRWSWDELHALRA